MYKITITTTYNTIVLEREDYISPELIEVYEQPYVKEVHIVDLEAKKKILKKEESKGE